MSIISVCGKVKLGQRLKEETRDTCPSCDFHSQYKKDLYLLHHNTSSTVRPNVRRLLCHVLF